jgi:hypothetical protein
MHKSLIALAVSGVIASQTWAQAAPQAQPSASPVGQLAPASAAPTVKKLVCQRVVIEETTGSRLGTAPKRCRMIDVPAPAGGGSDRAPAPSGAERG